ncbi:UMP kinase [Candidatus Nitrosacidococcus sp. I8]|uniref:UMP kinase n=1 Tax=Candidatus Nitrosacidococcus sp. I8 TaxID=2942908 RepID=UPI002226B4A0|nr:UMP kinase [Candidatus Nitrosacidococcus sp. I8]CAH9017451.1 Uridylate kinase [Candidatus Nitrosacidococcus sp. I8]
MTLDKKPKYRRILLKLSGEALVGEGEHGIDSRVVQEIAQELSTLNKVNIEIGLVIGGGNIFRGTGLTNAGIDRVTADHMGMLATVMNALALQNSLDQLNVASRVMSAIRINQVCEDYIRRRAVRHLEKGRIVIFAAGTGNPFFTTDTAASLRAIEIGAELLVKATKVNGIYSSDPFMNPNAEFFPQLAYDQVIEHKLGVMDATAIIMCRDHTLPIRVFDFHKTGDLLRITQGENIGTLVTSE